MKRYSKIAVVLALVVMASTFAAADDIGFTGNYSAGNWSFFNSGTSGGSGSISSTTMIITGNDGGSGWSSGSVGFTATAAYSAVISFNWSFTTYDSWGTGWDVPFYVTINGTNYFAGSGPNTQSGTISFNVNAGDTFSFGVYSVDEIFGPGELTITNFKSTAQVPEPATLFLMGTGLVGAAGTLRKRFAKA